MRPQGRGNDSDTVTGFGHREQGMRCSTFKLDVRLEPSKSACGVERPSEYESYIQKEQWMNNDALELDCCARDNPQL